MKNLFVIYSVVIILFFSFGCNKESKKEKNVQDPKPNIIFILTDDQGYGDLSCNGNPVVKTPNMDYIHDHAARFEDFMVSPTCAPTRAAIYSGKHEFKTGVYDTRSPRNHMDTNIITLADVLKKAGYVTGLFGKWHLGLDSIHRPENRGFDIALTSIGEQDYKKHFDPPLARNGIPETHKGYRNNILFDEAIKFIKQNKDKRFFCHIPTFLPHAPLDVPQKYSDMYNGNKFFGMIAVLDENIGRLLKTLKELHLEKNTLLILMSDNGATFGADIYNAGMRGVKTTAWYGGTRTFSFWMWPGTIVPEDINAQTAHVDILPTLAEIAGYKLPDSILNTFDGRSLTPLLENADTSWTDRVLFTHVGRWKEGAIDAHKYCQCNVRKGSYVAVRIEYCNDPHCWAECPIFKRVQEENKPGYYSKKHAKFNYAVTPKGKWALYNISKDISQEKNIADTHPEIVKELSEKYEKWWKKIYPKVNGKQKNKTLQK
ncbi:MAG: arylsulfatase [Chlorobi bacterium]|nr:arylsulfatase [Chlorobiota bacterium]